MESEGDGGIDGRGGAVGAEGALAAAVQRVPLAALAARGPRGRGHQRRLGRGYVAGVRAAVAGIAPDAWTTIKYTNAIYDEDQQRWISDAEVAEIDYTAFTSKPKAKASPPG